MSWWQILLGVLVGLVVLTILVVIHELGHAAAALRNGVEVEEFGIGFPPRAWATKLKQDFILKKGTVFSLNWLPIGGFCQMKGETDDATARGSYGAATLWAKTKILLAGVTFNFLAACIIFSVLAVTGLPKLFEGQFAMPGDTREVKTAVQVNAVSPDLPAAEAGLQAGDRVLAINSEEVSQPGQISQIAAANAGQTVNIEIARDVDGQEQVLEKSATIREHNDDNKGYLGLASGQTITFYSTWSAPVVGVVTTVQYVGLTFQGLGDLVVNLTTGIAGKIAHTDAAKNLSSAGDAVAGPVGILGTIFSAALAGGLTDLTLIAAIISLSLAVMNLLPIPGLDGGRWFLTLFFRFVLRKPLRETTEAKINAAGMLIIFGLIILITVVDVIKLF